MSAVLFFAPLFRRQAGRFALALLLSLVTLAAGVGLLGVSGWFLTAAALATAGAAFNLFGPSSLVRGLSLLRIVSRYGEKLIGHDATLRLLSDIRGWLFARLFPRLPIAGQGLRHGDLVSRLAADVDALDTLFLVALGPILTAFVAGGVLTLLLSLTIPGAAAAYAALFVLAALGVPVLLVLATRRTGAALIEASAAARIAVLDGIEGHADLIAFGETEAACRTFGAAADRIAALRRRLGTAAALASGAVHALAGATLLTVLWLGLDASAAGSLGGPMLVGLLLAVLGSFEATAAIVRNVAKLGAAAAAAGRLRTIATAEPAVHEPGRPAPLPPGSEVAFEAVTFDYDPARPVLRDLSLRIPPGRRVAIVGTSGTGKSTLLALLLRLRDPQAGAVRVAGADLRSVALAELHARVALVAQDAPVFLGTVRDNLLIGRADAVDADLWRVLDAARLGDVVRSLPEGLDTFLGESGRTLSVGQARRLCLARTLLSRAEIIVLDEPTSGLDRETEVDFLSDLGRAVQGRTAILVTHAVLPPGTVDAVYRLAQGRLVAQPAPAA